MDNVITPKDMPFRKQFCIAFPAFPDSILTTKENNFEKNSVCQYSPNVCCSHAKANDAFRPQLYLELGYNTEESFIDMASWDKTGQRSVTIVCYFMVFLLDYSSTLQKITYDD